MKIKGTVEPNDYWQDVNLNLEGVELRDLFACFALAGILTRPDQNGHPSDEVADTAYWYADAMLKRRDTKEGQ